MEKSPESPKSINSAVYGIQRLLRDLEKQWPALKKTDGTSTSDIHALGPVNLDTTRQEFASHIELIRTICSQFETEVLGDVMKLGAGADPAFRKHFTHLREQATLESTVTRTKDTLKMTKECLEEVISEYDTSQSKVQTQKLEKLGQLMGLVAFIDATQKHESGMPMTTITLGGNVIVVDIDLDEQGNVLRTKVSYVSEALQNDHDDRVDQLLAQSLRSHNLDLFKRNLGALALLDRLNVKHTPTDFFLVVKAMLNDAKFIYNQEILVATEDIAKVLMEGHGLPSYHLDFPGLSIAYWISKEFVIGNDWAAVRSSIGKDENHPSLCKAAKLLISFEECQNAQHFLPNSRLQYLLDFEETEESIKSGPNGEHLQVVSEPSWPKFMQPLRYIKVLSTYPEAQAVPVRYVAKLDPPLPASDAIIRKIMTITGLAGEDLANVANLDNASLSSATSLEKLLVRNVDKDTTLLQNESWVIHMKDMPGQVYKWMGSSETSGKIIHRIPFTHPVQVYNILQYLRQQQMFNTLFTSIFNSSATRQVNQEKKQPLSLDSILQESESDDNLYIQVASISAPHTLHFTLLLPISLQSDQSILVPFSVEIPRDMPARPVVRLHPPSAGEYDPMHQLSWNPDVFDTEKMTLVLQTSYSIPILVRWLWRRIANHQGEYTVKTPRLGLKRSKNSNDNDHSKQRRIKLEM